jgi:hypothetical protein
MDTYIDRALLVGMPVVFGVTSTIEVRVVRNLSKRVRCPEYPEQLA